MVSPEVMRLMSGENDSGDQDEEEGKSSAPGAAGIATPQRRTGDEAAAKTKIHIAQNMLEQTLPAYDTESDEGRAIMKVLSMLNERFGNDNQKDLVPAQILQLVNSEPSLGDMKKAIEQGQTMQKQQQQMQQQPPAGPGGAGAQGAPGAQILPGAMR